MSKTRRENPMTQNMLGLFGLDPNAGGGSVGAADDDAALSAELAALLAGEDAAPTSPKRRSRTNETAVVQSKKAPTLTLEQQVALSLNDPPDDGDDGEFDDDELLADFNELMEEEEDSSVSQEKSQPSPTKQMEPNPEPEPKPQLAISERDLATLNSRRDQYKHEARKAKIAGDLDRARQHIVVAKKFETVIEAATAGQPVDLSQMPPPPPEHTPSRSLQEDLVARMSVLQSSLEKAQEENNSSKARRLSRQVQAYKEAISAYKVGKSYNYAELCLPPGFEPLKAAPVAEAEAKPAAAAATESISLQEDLQQRMTVLTKSQAKAQEESNSSKARRLGRQVQAYKEAIAACKANRPYNYAELCLPPGFEPLKAPAPTPAPAPVVQSKAATAPMVAGGGGGAARPAGGPPAASRPPAPPSKLQRQLSRSANQTLVFLQDRQRQFKEAALKAKNNGKKDLALSLLRQAKGFDPMIGAAASGLPVDMSKLPPLPGEKEVDFEFLQAEDCEAPEEMQSDDPKVLYKHLASKLQAQINLCRANSARCVKMGDVMTASKFDRLLKTSQLDLAALRSAESHKDAVPRFHFEWKTFTTERTNPDLGDDALELQILRGIDLDLPSGYTCDQLDTYVRAELPFPSSEEAQVCRTDVIRGTNNPEYGGVHKFSVNRKARAFQRIIKSRAIKAEIYYKRGFLKSDKVLGTATIKLADLESHAELHNSFDLLEGRKAVGGRLEARLRLREPVGGRQVEETREKWLLIDAASRPASAAAVASSSDPKPAAASGTQSIEVMKYERDLLLQELRNRKSQLSPAAQDSLQAKGREIEKAIIAQDAALKAGGSAALKAYAAAIEKLGPAFNAEARQALKDNNRNKASVLITKKKLCEKEAAAIKARL